MQATVRDEKGPRSERAVKESVPAHASGPRPRWCVLLWGVAGFVAVVVILRLVLDPLANRETRKALDSLDGYVGDFDKVHVTVIPPGIEIWRFKLAEAQQTERGDRHALRKDPLVFVEYARITASLRGLVRGRVEGRLRLESPKIVIQQPEEKEPSPKPAAPDLSQQLRETFPLRIARVEVVDGELLFRQLSAGDKRPDELWLHRIELAAENVGTRRSLLRGRPATVSMKATLGRSGDMTAFASADVLQSPLSFAGEVALRGFRAEELYSFLAPKTGMKTEGTLDLFVSFQSKGGQITGGLKPVLKNIEVRAMGEGTWDRLKGWLADKSVEIASDRVPGRRAVATTIPVKGKLTDPEVQVWPAVLGVVRNAFVEGLVSGFSNVPPDTAEEKESVWRQAKDALKKDSGPPQAQPTK